MSDYSRTMLESVTDPMKEPPAEPEPELVLFDNLEGALVGMGIRLTEHGHKRFMVYDFNRCVEIIAAQMAENPRAGDRGERMELAVEYMSENILDCYAGDTTPAFLMPVEE